VAGKGKKNYILPAGEEKVRGRRGEKNYIMPAGEEKVRGRREKKNIIYRRPARWGEWPARKKKNEGNSKFENMSGENVRWNFIFF
jgi:hypothetical protein